MTFISLALFISCSDSMDMPISDQNKRNCETKKSKMRTLPFKAKFFTKKTEESDYPEDVGGCNRGPAN